MRLTTALAVGGAFAAATCSPGEAVGAGRLPVALSASPARIALKAPASTTIEVRNVGATRVVVDAAPRTRDRRIPAKWLSIRPARLALGAGARAVLTLRAEPRRGLRPGDHEVVVLLITRPLERRRVAVRLRLGIRVRVRMPGRIVRHLDVRGLRVRQHAQTRVLLVAVANAGNVTEDLRGRLSVRLVRGGKVLGWLRPRGPRELFPGRRTIVAAPYAGRARGPVTAVVRLRLSPPPRMIERRYRVRL